MVYDKATDKIKTTTAKNQRHAIKKIHAKHDITPKQTDHARPRTGQGELMSPEQFKEFMRN